ncbi:MAG: DUF4926 domain-containing protein [Pyrinomonadaceae bacterium]
MNEIKEHDVVALLQDVPEHGLIRGEVGTVVHLWKSGAYEVEFSDNSGRAYAFVTLTSDQLLRLCFRQAEDLTTEMNER